MKSPSLVHPAHALHSGRRSERSKMRFKELTRANRSLLVAVVLLTGVAADTSAQQAGTAAPQAETAADPIADPIKALVDRLELDKYKATIKGLTQFGDRRQGTDRNRAAVDWIEAQFKSYGCTNTERIKYDYQPAAGRGGAGGRGRGWRRQRHGTRRRRSRRRATRRAAAGAGAAGRAEARSSAIVPAHRCEQRSERAARRQASRAQCAADDARTARGGVLHQGRHVTRPDEMYIVGAHMDGHRLG